MQRITEPARSNPVPKHAEIRAAAAHCAQSKLLLLRVAESIVDPLQVPTLRDLAGVLQYVVASIGELEATR